MAVRVGREFLAIPGPTTIPDEVLRAMHRPAVDMYSAPLIALTDSLLRDLSQLFCTAGRSYIYIANGHGAWEAVLKTMSNRGASSTEVGERTPAAKPLCLLMALARVTSLRRTIGLLLGHSPRMAN